MRDSFVSSRHARRVPTCAPPRAGRMPRTNNREIPSFRRRREGTARVSGCQRVSTSDSALSLTPIRRASSPGRFRASSCENAASSGSGRDACTLPPEAPDDPVGLVENAENVFARHIGEVGVRRYLRRLGARRSLVGLHGRALEVRYFEHGLVTENDGALEHVLQLSNVAGPPNAPRARTSSPRPPLGCSCPYAGESSVTKCSTRTRECPRFARGEGGNSTGKTLSR